MWSHCRIEIHRIRRLVLHYSRTHNFLLLLSNRLNIIYSSKTKIKVYSIKNLFLADPVPAINPIRRTEYEKLGYAICVHHFQNFNVLFLVKASHALGQYSVFKSTRVSLLRV